MHTVLLLPIDTNVLDTGDCLNPIEFNILAVTTNTQGRYGGIEAVLPLSLKDSLARCKQSDGFMAVTDAEGLVHQLCTMSNDTGGDDTDFDYDYVMAIVDNGRHPVGNVIAALISQAVSLAETLRQGTPVLTLPIPRTGAYLRLTGEDMAGVARQICTHPEVEAGHVTLQLACRDRALHAALKCELVKYK